MDAFERHATAHVGEIPEDSPSVDISCAAERAYPETAASSPDPTTMLRPPPAPPRQSPLREYFGRWAGVPGKHAPKGWPSPTDLAVAVCGSFLSIGALALLNFMAPSFGGSTETNTMLIASFGATAVLLYAAPSSQFSQPRNCVGGHLLSALVGVTLRILIVERGCNDHGVNCQWLGCALAVSIATALMFLTGTTHPPGGATALIALTQASIYHLGYLYVIVPVLVGACTMVVVALLVNNAGGERHRYPQYWW